MLNWRTSQALPPAAGGAIEGAGGAGGAEDGVTDSPDPPQPLGVVSAEGGRLIFTGDWCYESSFEGCNLAAEAAASAAVNAIMSLGEVRARSEGGSASAVRGVGVAAAPSGGGEAAEVAAADEEVRVGRCAAGHAGSATLGPVTVRTSGASLPGEHWVYIGLGFNQPPYCCKTLQVLSRVSFTADIQPPTPASRCKSCVLADSSPESTLAAPKKQRISHGRSSSR